VQLHQSFRKRQADTQASFRSAEFRFHLSEHVEYLAHRLGRQPFGNSQKLSTHFNRHIDKSAGGRVFNGVGEQVGDDLTMPMMENSVMPMRLSESVRVRLACHHARKKRH
jgi:hypothetical protein